MRKFLLVFFALVLILAMAAGIGWLELQTLLMPASDKAKQVVVTIPRGANAQQIGLMLEEKGVVKSGKAFRYLATFKNQSSKLKAGEHVLDASLTTTDILKSLVEGRFKLYRFTVPEGRTMVQIAELAEASGLTVKEEFLALCRDNDFIKSLGLDEETLEGYLFPETYMFTREVTTPKIVKSMVDRFWKVWARYKEKAESQTLSRHEIVTLASIIEKETGAAFERPMIAGVFLNRLRIGMRLETDPTVIYGVENFDGNLTRKHLRTPTPYNTYVIEGLPPGPIASPGEESIKAVLEPADVEYIFFVSKNDGTHQFSKSLAEHNRAVNQYQRRRRN